MSKLIVLSGVAGVGKSTYSEKISKENNAEILSSDKIHVELTGDIEFKIANGPLEFQEIYKRTNESMKKNNNIIIDSTSISSKRRKGMLEQIKNVKRKELHQIIVPFDVAVERDSKRERKVGRGIIRSMYLNFFLPNENEGFDETKIIVDESFKDYIGDFDKNKLIKIIEDNKEHDEMFNELSEITCFKQIYNLPQDSSYHTFSVSRHTYYVLQHINNNYFGDKKLELQVTALFHDVGKFLAKEFKNNNRYANFIGHENASAQITYGVLHELGFEEEFVKEVSKLVQYHMRMPREGATEKSINKFNNSFDEKTKELLSVFREADNNAK